MKKIILIPVVLFALSVNAQSSAEKEVAAAVETLKKAMIDGNKQALEKIASEKLSYGHSSGLIEGKKEFVEKISSGASDFVTIELANQAITVSDKTAIVRHELHAKTNDGGKPGEAHIKVLLVFQKQKSNWVLLARQAVKMQ